MGNAIPDIPRAYTAIAEWLSCVLILTVVKPTLSRRATFFLSIGTLVCMVLFMELTTYVNLWLWIPCMLAAFGLMAAFIQGCTGCGLRRSIYYAVLAFVIAECMASLQWQIVHFFFPDITDSALWKQLAALAVIYGVFCLLMWRLLRLRTPAKPLTVSAKDVTSAVCICLTVFGFSNLSFVTANTPFSGLYAREIANIRTLVDISGVAILYTHYILCCENMMRRELEAVQSVLQTQYQQYKLSRESIDLINYKYHDIKHQINLLRSETDPGKLRACLDRVEADIKAYELQNKTGNSVLDTVLTGKGLYCASNGITLTCVADGTLLHFMDIMDICSIFGNALDNAIESVQDIQDTEKRLIHVTVSRMREFVMIRVENYFEGQLQMENGDFVTTKGSDPGFHGYGIKSIRYTAERYDGAVYIDADDHWFDLKILIPAP